ncbi:MAG: hypothetical protein WA667_28360 [Candidatus Nitrosopolaris sp.]
MAFSVRNQNDKSCGRGVEIDKGIHDINGFQNSILYRKGDTRFNRRALKLLWIREAYEEPVSLYLVSSKKI